MFWTDTWVRRQPLRSFPERARARSHTRWAGADESRSQSHSTVADITFHVRSSVVLFGTRSSYGPDGTEVSDLVRKPRQIRRRGLADSCVVLKRPSPHPAAKPSTTSIRLTFLIFVVSWRSTRSRNAPREGRPAPDRAAPERNPEGGAHASVMKHSCDPRV